MNNKESVTVNNESRRDFLKKAGMATLGATALWVAPKVTTVGAKPAYASVTQANPTNGFDCVYPPHGSSIDPGSVEFQWTSYPGAQSYKVHLFSGTGCENHIITATAILGNTTKTVHNVVLPSFSWQVEACDGPVGTGNVIATTGCCEFTVHQA